MVWYGINYGTTTEEISNRPAEAQEGMVAIVEFETTRFTFEWGEDPPVHHQSLSLVIDIFGGIQKDTERQQWLRLSSEHWTLNDYVEVCWNERRTSCVY